MYIDYPITPKTKIHFLHRHEETSQQSVILDDFSKPSPTDQESMDIDYIICRIHIVK